MVRYLIGIKLPPMIMGGVVFVIVRAIMHHMPMSYIIVALTKYKVKNGTV